MAANFKRRNSITFGKRHGEAADVDLAALGTWQANVLQKKLAQYSADDIYNADETGLFWKAFPDKTHKIKGERCAGGKRPRTGFLSWLEQAWQAIKMPLLVIGRFAKPRPFKNQEVPLDYEANARAWMTEIENTQEDEELNHLWIEFQDKCGFTGAGLFDYIDMDRNLATTSQQPILF